jgi:hypothetical protein
MLTRARWHATFPLSLQRVEKMMAKRGVFVDHATVHRWAMKILPIPAAMARRRERPIGMSWRMDETSIKVAGEWKYPYRAIDRSRRRHDRLSLRAKRDVRPCTLVPGACQHGSVADGPDSDDTSASSQVYSLAFRAEARCRAAIRPRSAIAT